MQVIVQAQHQAHTAAFEGASEHGQIAGQHIDGRQPATMT
jgi:hypothetical protein